MDAFDRDGDFTASLDLLVQVNHSLEDTFEPMCLAAVGSSWARVSSPTKTMRDLTETPLKFLPYVNGGYYNSI